MNWKLKWNKLKKWKEAATPPAERAPGGREVGSEREREENCIVFRRDFFFCKKN